MADDLASGFQKVDSAADFDVFSGCLTLVDSIPFFAQVKRRSYDLLALKTGSRVLDVGCGLGDDARAIAERVGAGGSVVGVDGSQRMVAAARSRHEQVEGLSFLVADAGSLPYADGSFAACRIDRVLQHVPNPASVIREMARVLRPGGVLVAYDNDWETLTVFPGERMITRTILNAWCDRFPSGWVGRELVPLFVEAGLEPVEAEPNTLVLRDLGTADRLYSFFATAEGAARSGAITGDDAAAWAAGLRASATEGRFFSSYTGFLVSGVRR